MSMIPGKLLITRGYPKVVFIETEKMQKISFTINKKIVK